MSLPRADSGVLWLNTKGTPVWGRLPSQKDLFQEEGNYWMLSCEILRMYSHVQQLCTIVENLLVEREWWASIVHLSVSRPCSGL